MITKYMSTQALTGSVDTSDFVKLDYELNVVKAVIDEYSKAGIDVREIKSPASFTLTPGYQNKIEVEFYVDVKELMSAIIAACLDKSTLFSLDKYFSFLLDEDEDLFTEVFEFSKELENSDVYSCDTLIKSNKDLVEKLLEVLEKSKPLNKKINTSLNDVSYLEKYNNYVKSINLISVCTDDKVLVCNCGNYVAGMFPVKTGACSVEDITEVEPNSAVESIKESLGEDFCDVDAFTNYGNNNVLFSITLLECLYYLLNELTEKKNESESEDACEVL